MAKGQGKQPKTFEQKVETDYPEFADTVRGLSVEELNVRISTYAKQLNEITESLKASEPIKAAREELNNMIAPFREGKKEASTKIRYIVGLIKSKGGQ